MPHLPLLDCVRCGTPACLAMRVAVKERYGIEVKLNHSFNDINLQKHVRILWQETKNAIINTYSHIISHVSIIVLLYCTKFLFGSDLQQLRKHKYSYTKRHPRMRTQTSTHMTQCPHTHLHSTHMTLFQKPSELAAISIFSQHQTNWKFFWKQTPTTQTSAPWLHVTLQSTCDMRKRFCCRKKELGDIRSES